jgi:hypothetical protein
MIEVTERCSVGNDAAGTTYDDPSATHDLSDERATAGDVRRKLITVSRFNAGDRPVQGRSATDTVSAQRKRGASSPAHARRLTCASARAGKSSVRQVRVIIFGFVRDNASTACLKASNSLLGLNNLYGNAVALVPSSLSLPLDQTAHDKSASPCGLLKIYIGPAGRSVGRSLAGRGR